MARTLSLPITISVDGSFNTVTHGNPTEIAQSLGLLLATRPGERRCNPDYGYPDPVFSGVDPELIVQAAADWEPRADIETIETVLTGFTEDTHVHIKEA